MEKTSAPSNLNWLLDDMVERAASARHAIVLSADGLLVGRSSAMSSEDGEHLAAMASAFQSLARGTGRHFGGGQVRQTVVEMDHAFLFVTAAGHGSCLAVVADEQADMGLIAYEMNLLVKQVGKSMQSALRVEANAHSRTTAT